ncbi:MAG TPA: TonB-dependent receptor [Paludibacter sp.]|nr:TonB-dependent receptor [Paludibacter sp.]
MKNLFLTFFLILSISLFASTKHTISGTITDATTGESLIGTSITVKDLPSTGVTTNAYGYFSLTLPDAKYTFVISYLGYEIITLPVNLNENKVINFKLKPNSQQLNDVEITAQRKNHNITSNEIGMEKLEVKELAKIPVLFGEADIMKTLKLTPGIKSAGEGSGGMFVRGGNNSQNLILLDEATVYNADHLLGFFSTFNSDAIKDIQMFKGTAPAEYGGRISSVLDVKMNDGNNQDYHVGGGIGLISSRLNVEGPIVKDKSSFLITGRRTYADLFLKLSSDDLINNNQLYFYDLNAKMNYIINDKNRLYLSGYFGRDVFEFQDRFGINWGNKTGTLRWNHIWNEKLFSNTSLIYSDYDYKVSIQDAGFSLTSIIKNWNLKHEFQYFMNSKNTLTFGLNSVYHTIIPGQLETSEESEIIPMQLQEKFAIDNGVYFSNVWKPSYNLNINYGIRMSVYHQFGPGDFYTYQNGEVMDTTSYKKGEIVKTHFNIEPRLNIAYILNDRNSLKISYTRNTQNLHLVSNSTSAMPTDIWLSSSNNVKPEIGDQVSLGYFTNFAKDKFQLSGEVYYRWMQNQLDLKNGADINANDKIEGELLFGKGRAYGLELLLKKKQGKLTGWVGYTFSRTERLIDGINNYNWYQAKQDITHDLSVVGIYDFNKKWSVSASWVYNTGNAVTFPSGKYLINGNVQYYYTERNGYRMPDYHRLDIGATRTLKKTKKFESSLNFSVYNAYGHKNPFSIDFEQDENDPSKTNAVMTYLFTYVPSITYNFKF